MKYSWGQEVYSLENSSILFLFLFWVSSFFANEKELYDKPRIELKIPSPLFCYDVYNLMIDNLVLD